MIFTIGYGKLTATALKRIAEGLDATVIDCRFNPISRRPGFGARQLATLLGNRYERHGHHLGGHGHTRAEGIAFIQSTQPDRNIVLMCAEHAPGDCHRHTTICAEHFPDALHIFEGDLIRAGELQRAIDGDDGYEVTALLEELLDSGRRSA